MNLIFLLEIMVGFVLNVVDQIVHILKLVHVHQVMNGPDYKKFGVKYEIFY